MSRPYLITGDRGFVGSRLRRTILARGEQVVGVDRAAAPAEPLPGYRPLVLDLADRDSVLGHAEQFRSAKAIFHLAARLSASENDPLPLHLEANLRATENLLEVADGAGVPLVLSSTMSVYGLAPHRIPVGEDQIPRPTEAYGLSKLAAECAAERMARAGRSPCIVLRYSGIFGLGYAYGAIHLYASRALAGEPVHVYGGGRIIRDYVDVDDVVAANLLAAEAAPRLDWGLYHVGGGQPMPLAEIAGLVITAVGGGEVRTDDRPGPFDFAFDISRARSDLGYAPRSLKERIAEYVEELKQARKTGTGSVASMARLEKGTGTAAGPGYFAAFPQIPRRSRSLFQAARLQLVNHLMSQNAPTKPSLPVSMARSYFPPDDIAVFQREAAKILEGGRVSMGPWVDRFQELAVKVHGARFALATNTCTSALEVALLACGVGPGDEVIVPVETFIATGMAVCNVGARPVFADIRAETLCLAPEELERHASPRVKAVILVHFGGLITPDITRIQEICRRHGWALIEDGAHSHGAKFRGLSVGSFGVAACFSYYPTKLVTAGEGGMIVTNDERTAKVCRSYQLRGQDTDLPGEQFARPYGRNIRMPELSALLGVLQYRRMDEFVCARRNVAAVYDSILADETSITRIDVAEDCFHNYWLYTVVLPAGVDREAIKKRCKEEWEIDVAWSYFPPLHLMPVFRRLYGTAPGQLPVAEDILARLLCLPIHPLISEADAACVAKCFLHTYRQLAG